LGGDAARRAAVREAEWALSIGPAANRRGGVAARATGREPGRRHPGRRARADHRARVPWVRALARPRRAGRVGVRAPALPSARPVHGGALRAVQGREVHGPGGRRTGLVPPRAGTGDRAARGVGLRRHALAVVGVDGPLRGFGPGAVRRRDRDAARPRLSPSSTTGARTGAAVVHRVTYR